MIGPFALHPKGTVPLRILPLAKALHRDGNDVLIILPPYDNIEHSGRSFKVDGIDVLNVAIPKTLTPLKYLLVVEELVRKAAEFHPHVIHVFKPKAYSGLAGMFIIVLNFLRIMDVPVVVDSDDLEGWAGFAGFFFEHKVYSKLMLDFFDFQEKWLLSHANAVTVASKFLEFVARKRRKSANHMKIAYVPNGMTIIPSLFRRNLKDPTKSLELAGFKVILLYTRFFEYDIEEVVDILSLVVSRLNKVKLLIVGKGEFGEEERLLKLADKKGLQKHVVYQGWVKPEQVRFFFEIADVTIYPFKDTPLNRAKCPGKLVQLMSYGKAIVADKVGQISEYIENGKSGLLSEVGDVNGFANLVIELLVNDELRQTLGNGAKKRIAREFNWETLAKRVLFTYNSVRKSKTSAI